jgi:tetratricopeptide (TPR) repeat protein
MSDRTLSWLLRGAVLTLVAGLVAFGVFYYADQHVAAPPTLIDQQVTAAENAVRKAPSNLDARLQLAAVYQADHRYDDALTQYKEILGADKGNRLALIGRGYVYLQTGDLDKAKADYAGITSASAKGEFAGADPQLQEAHYYLGVIAVMEKKPKDALAELDAALKIEATDSDALYQVGLAELQLGQPKLAVEAFAKALSFVPTGWCEPYTQMAAAYTSLGSPEEASFATAMATWCRNRPAEAKKQLQALTSGPAGVDAMLGLGMIAQTDGDNEGAISWYEKVLTVDRTNVSAMSALSALGVGPTSTPKSGGPTSTSTTQGHK